MIAIFFKQSKPVVFLILGIALSLLYFFEVGLGQKISFSFQSLGLIALKYLILISTFVIFELKIKFFEIQTGHSYVTLFFVLLTSFLIKDIIVHSEIFAFAILSIATTRLLNLSTAWNVKNSIFESVFLIVTASFFFKPVLVFLILVLVFTLTFTKSRWRYYIIPILAIGTVVLLTQVFYLYYYEETAGYQVFLPALRSDFKFLENPVSMYMAGFWVVAALVFLYQIYSVKQVRSLYHRQMASVFLAFLFLAFASIFFEGSTVFSLWLMSLWPFCIYLGDFISRIKRNLWLQIAFWLFVVIPLAFYLARLFDLI
jgi:hypothetical protein